MGSRADADSHSALKSQTTTTHDPTQPSAENHLLRGRTTFSGSITNARGTVARQQLLLNLFGRTGIDPATVRASLNTVEFRLRELNTGSYPRGLILMLNALGTWLYGEDPLSHVAFEAPLPEDISRLLSKLRKSHKSQNAHGKVDLKK